MAGRLSEYAVNAVPIVTEDDPDNDVRERVASSDAPLAIVVDAHGRRIASADGNGRYELVEAFQDTPIDVFARNPEAIEALRAGAPGVVLLDEDRRPISTVPASAILAYLGSAAVGIDPLIPGGPTTPNRVYTCGLCGFSNNVGVVVPGRTQCENSNPPYGPHSIK